ncbi:MAG: hypothetical protein U1F15_06955 [Burkholderiales bacterium]
MHDFRAQRRAVPSHVAGSAGTRLVSLVLGLLSLSSFAWAAETAEQPVWELDDSWTYARTFFATPLTHRTEQSSFTLVVREKGQDSYVMQVSGVDSGGKATQGRRQWSLATNFVNRGGSSGKLQEYIWYKWPLEEGKTWEMAWFQESLGEGVWKAKVRGWETVTVPAGTFRAMRIELDNSCYYGGVDAGFCGQADVVWYSPQVKRHVRMERRTFKGNYMGTNMLEELTAYSLH